MIQSLLASKHCFCLGKSTNRQLATLERSILTYHKHSWGWNLLKNNCSVFSPGIENSSTCNRVQLNNAISNTWPELPVLAWFPCPSISDTQGTKLSVKLKKQRKKMSPPELLTAAHPAVRLMHICEWHPLACREMVRLWQHWFRSIYNVGEF